MSPGPPRTVRALWARKGRKGGGGRGQGKVRLLEELQDLKANLVRTESFFSLGEKESFCSGVMGFSQVSAFEKGEIMECFSYHVSIISK